MKLFVRDLGIDLGTANTLVYVEGKGIVLQEPTVIAINTDTKQVLAVGDEARAMIGRTPGNVIAVRPMQEGRIADFDITLAMLKYFMEKSAKRRPLFRPKVVVAVPSGVTAVEKRAVVDAALQAGAKTVQLIEEPLAAAMGAGLPVADPTGSLIVNIGGGTTEIAVISLGGLVVSRSIRVAGNVMDEAIMQHLRKTANLLVGERTAEQIKIQIGSAMPLAEELTMTVAGRDLVRGLPRSYEISSQEVRNALSETLFAIVEGIKVTLESAPPELASDIMTYGIVLSGGGALLRELDRLIAQETLIPVHVAPEPLLCVARGVGIVIEGTKGGAIKRSLFSLKNDAPEQNEGPVQ